MNKKEIRQEIKQLKDCLTDNEKRQSANRVFKKITETELFHRAHNILLYNSLSDELFTKDVIHEWCKFKNIFLPRVNGDNLEILPYDANSLEKGSFNIYEPMGENTCDISIIDMIIVPAIAYDRNGNRIGRGKGYYDRLLQKASALKIGVGYDFQLIPHIDSEPHDIPVDIIVTPNNFINCRKK
ncbi:MAG: 5-formyltetrahydrofolate cyclo-ligase [Muribaculaceae bacterium]|nr:5-formyltetrahydrofolate cyclo-ligase [Muribaculaceae bacterium]